MRHRNFLRAIYRDLTNSLLKSLAQYVENQHHTSEINSPKIPGTYDIVPEFLSLCAESSSAACNACVMEEIFCKATS